MTTIVTYVVHVLNADSKLQLSGVYYVVWFVSPVSWFIQTLIAQIKKLEWGKTENFLYQYPGRLMFLNFTTHLFFKVLCFA